MTPLLRRTHRTIWLALAVVLPFGFGIALHVAEQPPTQEPASLPLPAAIPTVVHTVDTPALTVTLRQATQPTDFQLDVFVKIALEVPSAVVRIQRQSGWRSVGLLNAPGLYRFDLPGTDAHPRIDLFDDIHQRTLYTVQL